MKKPAFIDSLLDLLRDALDPLPYGYLAGPNIYEQLRQQQQSFLGQSFGLGSGIAAAHSSPLQALAMAQMQSNWPAILSAESRMAHMVAQEPLR